jgi:hypothetical protein
MALAPKPHHAPSGADALAYINNLSVARSLLEFRHPHCPRLHTSPLHTCAHASPCLYIPSWLLRAGLQSSAVYMTTAIGRCCALFSRRCTPVSNMQCRLELALLRLLLLPGRRQRRRGRQVSRAQLATVAAASAAAGQRRLGRGWVRYLALLLCVLRGMHLQLGSTMVRL